MIVLVLRQEVSVGLVVNHYRDLKAENGVKLLTVLLCRTLLRDCQCCDLVKLSCNVVLLRVRVLSSVSVVITTVRCGHTGQV
jgi:hypothetical protein